MRFRSSSLKIESVLVSTGTDPWHTRHWTRMRLPGPTQQGLQALCGEGTEPRDPSSPPRRRASWTPPAQDTIPCATVRPSASACDFSNRDNTQRQTCPADGLQQLQRCLTRATNLRLNHAPKKSLNKCTNSVWKWPWNDQKFQYLNSSQEKLQYFSFLQKHSFFLVHTINNPRYLGTNNWLGMCSCSHAESLACSHSEMVTPWCQLDLLQTTWEKGSVIRVNIISFTKYPTVKVGRKDLPKETNTDQMS